MEDRAKAIIEKMNRERGYPWLWKEILAHKDPEFTEKYHEMAMYLFHERKALPLKFKEILAVCLDAVQFYEGGFRVHLRNALKAGATVDEIMEALELTTLLGMHTVAVFMPALEEELKAQEVAKKK